MLMIWNEFALGRYVNHYDDFTDKGLFDKVLGAVGHLPSILTELEVSYYLLR